jgi:biopolymer transport protein TolR
VSNNAEVQMNKPSINVTPLIDVLLVLLIVFMVISPLKPSAFQARIPGESQNLPGVQNDPRTLLVTVGKDRSLILNGTAAGSVDDSSLLVKTLEKVFTERLENGDVSTLFADAADRPVSDRIERTVFIKAPRSLDYGSVASVLDAAKLAGAYPISLQIDRLD